ncbi:MAG: hypothetical protein ACYS30_20835 [Planctomycetota bacterium]|jgi:hypothetical protein
MSLTRRFKSYFLHGLAVLLPSILTIWLFVWGYTFMQEKISVHINRGLVHVIALAANEGVEISDAEVEAYVRDTREDLKDDPEQIEMRAKLPEIERKARIRKLKGNLAKTGLCARGAAGQLRRQEPVADR